MPSRPVIFLLAVLSLLLGFGDALTAATGPSRWKAVLVAGDNAQPVFDNAVAAVDRWLTSRGVPQRDVHVLSATQRAQRPGELTAEPASAERVLGRIAALRPAPGDGCFVFITSHGQRGEGIWLAYSGEFLQPAGLAQALSAGCASAPTVVIVSGCFSGAFTRIRAPNRIVSTAARSDRPSFGCQADRTYAVFDECLLAALPRSATWRAVFKATTGCVRGREGELEVVPSQPQASFGARVRDLPVR